MVPKAAPKIQLQAKTQKEHSQADAAQVEGGHLCCSNNYHMEMLLPEKWHFQQKHLLLMSRLSNIQGAYQENVFEAEVWELKSLSSFLNFPPCSYRTLNTLLNVAKLMSLTQLNKQTKR